MTYRNMNPYFKGVHIILDNWRPYMDEEVWILIGEELNIFRSGREVGRGRGGQQTHTGDVSSTTVTGFTRPRKTHCG